MKIVSRDPGLQPERTSLAWLRTHMVLFAVGVLLLKVSDQSSMVLGINAIVLICFALFFSYYSKQRFGLLFKCTSAVGIHEIPIKKLLSLIIFISAIVYLISSIMRYNM